MSESAPSHSENVANLGILTSKTQAYGTSYNPTNPMLAISNLIQLRANGEAAINAVVQAEINADKALSLYRILFVDFEPTVTRISNLLSVCGAPAEIISNGQSIIRQLRGKRASELLTAEEVAAEKAKGNEVKQVTIHNSTMESRVKNFGILIQFLSTVPEYAPNEVDLTVAALAAKHADIKAKNEAVIATGVVLETARSKRKAVLYTENTGLVDVSLSVKQYVKAVFGASSDQFNQVKGIRFINKN